MNQNTITNISESLFLKYLLGETKLKLSFILCQKKILKE